MKFTPTHEWIELTDEIGVVGVTDHAQKELGDIVYVELPQVNKEVKAGQEAVVLESTKAAAEVYSPVTGQIIEVNSALSQTPELINQSPEKEGWLYKVRLSDLKEFDKLLDAKAYLSRME
jgi:glycine cleavage system H protein